MAAELLRVYEPEIEALELVPSDSGRFEVTVNERLIFSKLNTHRHAEPGEVAGLVRAFLEERQ